MGAEYEKLRPKPDRAASQAQSSTPTPYLATILTAAPVVNKMIKIVPLVVKAKQAEHEPAEYISTAGVKLAVMMCDGSYGDKVLIVNQNYRNIAISVCGTGTGGGTEEPAGRPGCCEELPAWYLIPVECGLCLDTNYEDPCGSGTIDVQAKMPRIMQVRLTNVGQAEGYECENCDEMEDDVIDVTNVGTYDDPTCTWSGIGPHCQLAEVVVGDEEAVLTVTPEGCEPSTWTIPIADFKCCGTTVGWVPDPENPCVATPIVSPHPCTCCPPEPSPPPSALCPVDGEGELCTGGDTPPSHMYFYDSIGTVKVPWAETVADVAYYRTTFSRPVSSARFNIVSGLGYSPFGGSSTAGECECSRSADTVDGTVTLRVEIRLPMVCDGAPVVIVKGDTCSCTPLTGDDGADVFCSSGTCTDRTILSSIGPVASITECRPLHYEWTNSGIGKLTAGVFIYDQGGDDTGTYSVTFGVHQ